MTHTAANVINDAYRFYDDDVAGGIASQTALAAVDTDINIDADTKFHVALLATETAGGEAKNYAYSVEYRKNGGAWTDLTTTTSAVVYAVAADNCTTSDNASYGTTALTTGATIQATEYCNNADAANSITLTSASFEKTSCVVINSTGNAGGDTFEFRLTNNGTALDADTTIGTVTLNTLPDALNAADIQAVTNVDSGAGSGPAVGQEHVLLAADIQAVTNVTAPALTENLDDLLADNVQSATNVTAPYVSDGFPLTDDADVNLLDDDDLPLLGSSGVSADALLAADIESATKVTAPQIGQEHAILAADIRSVTNVTAPQVGQEHTLLAADIESATTVTAPNLGQEHGVLAADIESVTQVGGPVFGAGYPLTDDLDTNLTDDGDLPLLGSADTAGVDNLLANNVQAVTNVTAPVLARIPNLDAANIEAATQVTAPALAETHILDAANVQAATNVTAPVATHIHVLAAADIESATNVTSPAVGQEHTLNAADIQSVTQVTAPQAAEGNHNLLADDIQSLTNVTAPTVQEIHNLTVTAVQSATQTAAPVIGQAHTLDATNIQSSTTVTAPVVAEGNHNLTAANIEAVTNVTAPALGQVHDLDAANIQSVTQVAAPALGQVHGLAPTVIESMTNVAAPALDPPDTGEPLWDDESNILTDDDDLPITASSTEECIPLFDDENEFLTDDQGLKICGSQQRIVTIQSVTTVTAPGLIEPQIAMYVVYEPSFAPNDAEYVLDGSYTGVLHWIATPEPFVSIPQIEAGDGTTSGVAAISGSSGSGIIDLSSIPNGEYYVHAVFKRSSPVEYSNVALFTVVVANLDAADVQSVTQVTSPTLTQGSVNDLFAADIESVTTVTSPQLEAGDVNLFAADIQSVTQVTAPQIAQTHATVATAVESLTQVTAPSLGQAHVLDATNVESVTTVTAPDADRVFPLTAQSIESATTVPTLQLGPPEDLVALDLESLTTVTAPQLLQVLGVAQIQSVTTVTAPVITTPRFKNARNKHKLKVRRGLL